MNEQPNVTPEVPASTAVNSTPAGGQPDAPAYSPQQNIPYNGQPNPQLNPQQNMGYNPPPMQQPFNAPVGQLKTNKSLLKFILLSAITFGIYGIVVMSSVSSDINVIASRYDGKKTMHYCLVLFLIGPITLGIAYLVWFHNLSARIGNELRRRNIFYNFSATDFWLWCVLGSIIIVGPFVYYYKLFKATNQLCEHYNVNG